MAKTFNITLIGTGNVAWHLAPALENSGNSVKEVYGRNLKHAEKLCSILYDSSATDSLDFSASKSNVFIIAVSDAAISEIASEMVVPENSIVVHTSGTLPLEALQVIAAHTGVFYPLQTFTKGRKLDFRKIPVCVEAEDKNIRQSLITLAESISSSVVYLHSDQRRVLHAAAVFASNFTNHMLTISKGLLESEKLKFDILKPLITETIQKSFEIGPENSQTGPARRNDKATIEDHLNLLSLEKGLMEIYKSISEDIIKTYHQ